jgi:threonyl-tRNA synthetase
MVIKKQKVIEKLKNDPLMPLRHSAEHVLHMSVEALFPGAKKVMGPPIEDGFYFDVDYDGKITADDFQQIEARMQEIVDADLPVTRKEVSYGEAKQIFADNPYKLEMISELEKNNEPLTIYEFGSEKTKFHDVDLCAGPHVKSTGEIKAFKLLSVAGAYWHGDEKNKMLTRIYATAFDTKKNLAEYLEKLEEAKRRDHRKLGKELELFTFSEDIGAGLPLWLPKGTVIKEELEKWGKETEDAWGYKRVASPFLTKKRLFEISAHVPYFENEMYKVQVPGDDKEEYYIRPMNCPFHHEIYKARIRSYKELPLRLAEFGTVARYEDSGALNGILRPRIFTQNDAHIYCSEEQAVDEFVEIINLHRYYYDKLGIKDYYIVLALRDPAKKDKYHGNEAMWQKAEQLSREAMDKSGIMYTVVNEGAAHYGPKMDFKIKSAIGNEYGISTNQIDLFMPERFGLTYIDKNGEEKPVIVQHRAPLGSDERFIGFLIENFAGAFPVWLSPVQIVLVPIGEKHIDYAKKLQAQLKEKRLRVELDDHAETMQAKIRDAQVQKVPYMFILGDREVQTNQVSVRLRSGENYNGQEVTDVINKITDIYLTRSLNLW